jgi:hypothetical protein
LSKFVGFSGRHWIVLRKAENNFYFILDSQEKGPQLAGTAKQAEDRLRYMKNSSNGAEILVVFRNKYE